MARPTTVVGTCGFPSSRAKLYSLVDGVETQESFYNLLGEKALENLRNRPRGFHLTMKAWQATTHPYTSPTWRRMKAFPPGDKTRYGWLRCTKENLWALERALQQAVEARAEVLVFQTPSNMPYNDRQIEEIGLFFRHAIEIARGSLAIAWEPRGEWIGKKPVLDALKDMGVVIVTDYLRNPPLYTDQAVAYTRLHGIGGKEVNYRYKYSEGDLLKLRDTLAGLTAKVIYVMFNNVHMLEDAIKFKEMLKG